jgi:hypothetical protein
VLEDLAAEFGKVQEKCYVSGKHAVLVVLQGLDTSGKDGAVKALLSGLNTPLRVEAFKKPTEEELSHDYLWRVHKVAPARGQITVRQSAVPFAISVGGVWPVPLTVAICEYGGLCVGGFVGRCSIARTTRTCWW